MLAFSIALRFLKSSKGQTFLIILGIAIGISVQIFIGSLIQGLQTSLIDKTIGNSSHVTITHVDSYISDYKEAYNIIDGTDNVKSISYSVDTNGSIINDDIVEPIFIRGFDIDLSDNIYELKDKVIDGNIPVNNNEILLGESMLKKLNLSIGDMVDIQIPLKGIYEVKVVGVYDFNIESINDLWVISTIPTVQDMLLIEDKVSSIEIQVNDVFLADESALNIKNQLNDSSLSISNWKERNAELLSGLQGQSSSSLMIQVFVTLSVVLGIASVLAITVLQKSKQIGILKAMGLKDSDASKVFLFEGIILGFFGAILGVILGLTLAYVFSTFALNPDGTPVVPLYINPIFISVSAVIAIISSGIASIIPALRSKRLSVIEVIRNG